MDDDDGGRVACLMSFCALYYSCDLRQKERLEEENWKTHTIMLEDEE